MARPSRGGTTFLTLVLLPVLFEWTEKRKAPISKLQLLQFPEIHRSWEEADDASKGSGLKSVSEGCERGDEIVGVGDERVDYCGGIPGPWDNWGEAAEGR
jgi:hypothetical protein